MSDGRVSESPASEYATVERFEPGESHAAVIRLSVVAALGGFLFGYDSAVINGAVGAIENVFSASAAALGLAVSSTLVGAALGAFSAGRIADQAGRRAVMVVAAILFLISAVGSGVAGTLFVLAIFRFIGGVAVAWPP